MLSYVDEGAGVPDSRLLQRGQHGVASTSIGLETARTLFRARRCDRVSPKNHAGPQIAIGATSGDALSLSSMKFNTPSAVFLKISVASSIYHVVKRILYNPENHGAKRHKFRFIHQR